MIRLTASQPRCSEGKRTGLVASQGVFALKPLTLKALTGAFTLALLASTRSIDAAGTAGAPSTLLPTNTSAVRASSATSGSDSASGSVSAASGSTAGAAAKSGAARAITVTLPSGHYLLWTQQASTKSVPVYVSSTASTTAEIAATGSGPAALYVLDPVLDRLDIVPNATPRVAVKPADLNRFPEVIVDVKDSTGKPMDYARVDVTGPDGVQQSDVLVPADGGRLTFSGVPVGRTIATATREGVSGTVKLDTSGTTGEPAISVLISAASTLPVIAAATVAEPHRVAARTAPVPAPAPAPSGFAGTVISLLLLALVVILVVWGVTHQDEVKRWTNRTLEKMGLSPIVPEEPAADPGVGRPSRIGAAVGSDPSICPFCGTRKDPTTGSCACTLVPAGAGTASPVPIGSASLSAGPRLITLDGPARGQIFPIASSATVGRDAGNTIALSADTAVSRRHATFTNSDGQVEVADEGSSNGTFVNGSRVTRQPLNPSDEIQIGHSRFRFEVS